jgi:DNA polymerase type B, organellar and viral
MAIILKPRYIETRGRPRIYNEERAQTKAEERTRHRAKKFQEKLEHVAVLDFETDPFNNKRPDDKINPFSACIYSDQFKPIVIWENDLETFVEKLMYELENLPGAFTIYAHNGGKFDFMFLIHKLRGAVSFKGRGIMAMKIGQHDFRDSFHIIPERLANYKKDKFDYNTLTKKNRDKHREKIINYMVNDCVYLFDIVKSFLKEFGFKISIGQAAMADLKKHYTVAKIGEHTDSELRQFFFGGRVECLGGKGHFTNGYNLYDVNSMYPDVMARCLHPIGNHYSWRRNGGITNKTCFVDLTCTNYGALVCRTDNNETTATVGHGRFKTTIHEYKVALELGLITDIKFHHFIDCDEFSNFEKFVVPHYEKRLATKTLLKQLQEGTPEYDDVKKNDIFTKLLLNNAFGKFAQNPRRYKDNFITEHGALPPKGYEDCLLPSFRCNEYDIWERPAPRRSYNNVGTAASITGASRAVLMQAIHNAVDPIYCDTDSLICKTLLNTEIDSIKLGAWDLEKSFDEVIIAGKKLYAWKAYGKNGQADEIKVKSKGAPGGALDWGKMLQLLDDQIIEVISTGPTLTKTGKQFYMRRNIRATAHLKIKRDVSTLPIISALPNKIRSAI